MLQLLIAFIWHVLQYLIPKQVYWKQLYDPESFSLPFPLTNQTVNKPVMICLKNKN